MPRWVWTRKTILGAIVASGSALFAGRHPAYADDQRIYRSPHFLGRGDTGIATATNHDAIFYNPAGLAYGEGLYKETVLLSPMVEVSASTKNIIRQVAVEKTNEIDTLRQYIGKNQHIGLQNFTGLVFRRVALGVLASSTSDILISKSAEQGGLEVATAEATANEGLTFSLAEGFFNQFLLLGVTTKYLNRQQGRIELGVVDTEGNSDSLSTVESGMASAGGADIGMMLRGQGQTPMSLGVVIENIGDTKMDQQVAASYVTDLKQTINIGFAIEPGTKVSKIGLFCDYRDVTGAIESNPLKRIHMGAELNVKEFLGFTAGLNQGYPTFGTYLNLYLLRFDIGGYTEEMGEHIGTRPDPRGYFRLTVGF